MDEMSVSRGPNDPTRAESTRGDAGPAQPAAGVSCRAAGARPALTASRAWLPTSWMHRRCERRSRAPP